jgi:UDP:flavonoid glycosyltransferase YjiC (YdhE family)
MSIGKRIVFATFGSLGDLHPYIPLAMELKRRGHKPVIATFDAYREAVESEDIAFAAMRPAADALGDRIEILRRLFTDHRGPEYLVRNLFMPHLRASFDDLWQATEGADLLVTHPIAFAGPLVAEKRRMPWASTVLAPLSLFSAIDPPLFAAAPFLHSIRKLGVTPYRWAFALAKRMAGSWEKPLHALRAELGIPSARLAQFEGQYSPRLNLALFSPLLAAPQADWPVNTVLCGFPRYDGAPLDAGTQADLDAFLAAGEPPIVFGLGSSAVMIAGDFWDHAIAAAQRLGRRALLITGMPLEGAHNLPSTIKAFDSLPYSAVFPRAAATVHSGGIGTLAQALASGRPQLVVPVAFDQADNARRAMLLGCARVLPFKQATAGRLTQELEALLGSPEHARRAAAVSGALRQEDGARTACDELASLVARS